MAVVVKHNKVCGGVHDASKEVSKDHWNEDHVVEGLGSAAEADTTAFEVAGAVDTHAAANGAHAIAGVTGLQTALDGKAADDHTHTGLVPTGGTTGQVLKKASDTNFDYTWNDDETGSGGVEDGDKGDISVSDSGATWTIDSGVISAAGRELINDANAAAQLVTLGLTATAAELNALDGITATVSELNILDGVTSTAAELNILDGVTSTAAELNILDGVTATATEINHIDGVTSAIQTQLDAKQATLVSGTNIKTINGSTVLGSGDLVVSGSSAMPRGHIWGLTMSNAADAAHDITVAAGEARSEDGTEDIVLSGAITKQIDAGWSVGTGAGGLNTGDVANVTWYEVHLIKRTDTGVVDVMFTTTASRATLPANYDKQRRIGWVRSDGSANLLAFTQVDDYFTLTTQLNDVAANKSTTAAAVTLTAPPNSIARFRATADMSTSVNANSVIVFSEVAEGAVTPALATGIGSLGYWDLATGASAGHFELRVNASSQIEHDASVAVGAFDISTFGWIDNRCRLSNT